MTEYLDVIYTSPFSDDEVEKVRAEWRTYPERYSYAAGRWVATVDRARAEATAAAEQRLRNAIEEAESDAPEEARRFAPPFEGGFREGARWALNRWRSAHDTPPPTSPRQGEPVDVERLFEVLDKHVDQDGHFDATAILAALSEPAEAGEPDAE